MGAWFLSASACSVAVLAIWWLVGGKSDFSHKSGESWTWPKPGGRSMEAVATRHTFNDLRSGSLERPTSVDSPDLEAWLTTTREGLLHQRATLARQRVSPSTVVFDASMLPGADHVS